MEELIYFHARNVLAAKKQALNFTTTAGN